MAGFKLPRLDQRLYTVGRTGSGKTQAGFWVLSKSEFNKQPFVIVDYKRDGLLNSSKYIKELDLGDIPKYPGLYIVHPQIFEDDGIIEDWLRRIHGHEKIGLFFDEIYMVPGGARSRRGSLQAILTQGRSKHIPVIALSQRPVDVNSFVKTEADHFQVFHLLGEDDEKTVEKFLPRGCLSERLPEYHSRWFSVAKNSLFKMKPVPSAADILEKLETRLRPKRKYY